MPQPTTFRLRISRITNRWNQHPMTVAGIQVMSRHRTRHARPGQCVWSLKKGFGRPGAASVGVLPVLKRHTRQTLDALARQTH